MFQLFIRIVVDYGFGLICLNMPAVLEAVLQLYLQCKTFTYLRGIIVIVYGLGRLTEMAMLGLTSSVVLKSESLWLILSVTTGACGQVKL